MLRSYTDAESVLASGPTLDAMVNDLERQFPGIRFRIIDEQQRIRPHIKVFVNALQVRSLALALATGDEVIIVAALSGG